MHRKELSCITEENVRSSAYSLKKFQRVTRQHCEGQQFGIATLGKRNRFIA
jgi:hypothetical protein